MKGLTPAEHEALAYAAGSMRKGFADGSLRHLAMLDLLEQGRVYTVRMAPHHLRWFATPAGREALRLWPLVKAAMEGSR